MITIHDPDSEQGNEPLDHLSESMEQGSVDSLRPGRPQKNGPKTLDEVIGMLRSGHFQGVTDAIRAGNISVFTCLAIKSIYVNHHEMFPPDLWNLILEESDLAEETL